MPVASPAAGTGANPDQRPGPPGQVWLPLAGLPLPPQGISFVSAPHIMLTQSGLHPLYLGLMTG